MSILCKVYDDTVTLDVYYTATVKRVQREYLREWSLFMGREGGGEWEGGAKKVWSLYVGGGGGDQKNFTSQNGGSKKFWLTTT